MYWQGVGGGITVQGGLSCPPLPRISERMDNQQFLFHHVLQKYLVERDINFTSVNLKCLLQTFSWVTYWQGVGGKLSRAVYLAPPPPPRISVRINNPQILLLSTIGIFCWKRYKLFFNQSEMLTSNVQLGYVLTRDGGKLSRAVYLAPRPEFQIEYIIP